MTRQHAVLKTVEVEGGFCSEFAVANSFLNGGFEDLPLLGFTKHVDHRKVRFNIAKVFAVKIIVSFAIELVFLPSDVEKLLHASRMPAAENEAVNVAAFAK